MIIAEGPSTKTCTSQEDDPWEEAIGHKGEEVSHQGELIECKQAL